MQYIILCKGRVRDTGKIIGGPLLETTVKTLEILCISCGGIVDITIDYCYVYYVCSWSRNYVCYAARRFALERSCTIHEDRLDVGCTWGRLACPFSQRPCLIFNKIHRHSWPYSDDQPTLPCYCFPLASYRPYGSCL